VKNATTCAKKLTALLKKLPAGTPPEAPGDGDPIALVVMSMLMWESTTEKAANAYTRALGRIVDFNDLRVCMPDEIEALIGVRYPRALERSQRLRAMLKDIYNREHAVTLDRLADLGKRDVKIYLDSLDGMVPYVSGRVLLLGFDGHAVPADEQLRDRLIEAGAADESADVTELSNWLARRIKASDSLGAHLALQRWVDQGARSGRGRQKTPTGRKTGKKTTGRSSSTSKTTRSASTTSGRRTTRAAGRR
jgi:hypothetical protein